MIAIPSGASGISIVQRWIRNVLPSRHSKLARSSPGHGGPPGGVASKLQAPSRLSRRSSAGCRSGRLTRSLELPAEVDLRADDHAVVEAEDLGVAEAAPVRAR